MIHGPRGDGHGRWALCFKISIIRTQQSASRHLAAPNIPFLNHAESNVYVTRKERGHMDRKATAVWTGGLKDGKGSLSTDSGVLKQTQYSFSTRFENGVGTNPEELLAAAHAGCFTMALSGQLGSAGMTAQKLETTATVTLAKVGDGFSITKSHLDLVANIPGADKAKFDAAVKAAETGCPVSKLFKAEITVNARLQS
jgi:lipoyl-dependent peroxiredoxin